MLLYNMYRKCSAVVVLGMCSVGDGTICLQCLCLFWCWICYNNWGNDTNCMSAVGETCQNFNGLPNS